MANSTCSEADSAFGPVLPAGCRGADLTLAFEQSILTLLPAAIFLIILPARIFYLSKQSTKSVPSKLRIAKVVGYVDSMLQTRY